MIATTANGNGSGSGNGKGWWVKRDLVRPDYLPRSLRAHRMALLAAVIAGVRKCQYNRWRHIEFSRITLHSGELLDVPNWGLSNDPPTPLEVREAQRMLDEESATAEIHDEELREPDRYQKPGYQNGGHGRRKRLRFQPAR